MAGKRTRAGPVICYPDGPEVREAQRIVATPERKLKTTHSCLRPCLNSLSSWYRRIAIRAGRRQPHPRHWETLWELVGISPKGSGLAIPAVPKQTEEKLGVKLLASPAEKAHEDMIRQEINCAETPTALSSHVSQPKGALHVSFPYPYYPLYRLTGIAIQMGKLLHPAGGTAIALSGFEQNRKCRRLHTQCTKQVGLPTRRLGFLGVVKNESIHSGGDDLLFIPGCPSASTQSDGRRVGQENYCDI